MSPRLELRKITKAFPGCLANDAIDLEVNPGEIHALLGENGAGKSTLVKIIYGVLQADSGEIVWQGKPVRIANPHTARRLGIGMVFQHFSLFETLTVAENIALGMEGKPSLRKLSQEITTVSERYGLPLDPQRLVHALSVGERQRVEIVRCLLQNPKLLIMDEPTSVLTPQEVHKLFDTLRRLAKEGCSILYISHKLEEIQSLCQWATVLRSGKVSAACDPNQEDAHSLARMMIGSDLPKFKRPIIVPGNDCLVIDGLSLPSNDPFGTDLDAIKLAVREREIVGIAGVAGNGQQELLTVLSGEQRLVDEEHERVLRLDGESIGRLGPAQRRREGLAFVPEERLGRGAVADLSLTENALLTNHQLAPYGWVRFGKARKFARLVRERFKVVSNGIGAVARSLSGGNLQKFIVGREVLQNPRVLIAAHPTWGVDVGAAAAIHQALIELRNHGAAVLVVSEDLDELFTICDRIAVLSSGKLSQALETATTNAEELGLLMSGQPLPAKPRRVQPYIV